MLWFESILLHNFGPFRGFQEVRFPEKPGVTLIVGENMRGKTSFLNSLRFALFGATQDRLGNPHRLYDLINDEAKAADEFDMLVTLRFRVNETRYTVTRTVKRRAGGARPVGDGELEMSLHLQRDDENLSKSQSERELRRIMPETVSRFFLFDGELLQQYEELVVQSSSSARDEIRESIERVLGVPLLISARDHCADLRRKAEREHSAAISRDGRNQRLVEEMNAKRLAAEAYEQEISQFDTLLAALNTRRKEIERELSEQSAFVEALNEEQRLETELRGVSEQVLEKRVALSNLLPLTWRELVGSSVRRRIDDLEAKRASVQEELGGLRAREEEANSLRRAIHDSTCPTCGHALQDAVKIEELQTRLRSIETDTSRVRELSDQSAELHSSIRSLSVVVQERLIADASALQSEIDGLEIEHGDVERRLSRVRDTIQGRDGKEVSSLQRDLQEVIEAQGVNKVGRKEAVEKAAKARGELRASREKLPEADETDQIRSAKAFVTSTSGLEKLFSDAVDLYRSDLRKRVEERSSTLFLSLTSEPDYSGLRINNDYGLSIIRNDGSDVAIRSAGAEHLVAMSLIAALQSSSPRPGPIFVDSPMGRLDETHRQKLLCALPAFTKQVVLLGFERELSLAQARALLGEALVGEIHLERRTSSHTEIVQA